LKLSIQNAMNGWSNWRKWLHRELWNRRAKS